MRVETSLAPEDARLDMNGSSRSDVDLDAIDAAFATLLDAIAELTDEAARAPSSLPGWTRGHVLTHLARSGEGDALTVEGAILGEVLEKYPGGPDQRTRDIEAGATRSVDALRADLVGTQRRLVDAWAGVRGDTWERMTLTPMGPRTVAGTVQARRREILVHLVDLDIGVAPADLPPDYLTADREWLSEFRPSWSPNG
jgi:maleylpyruvate isomerase